MLKIFLVDDQPMVRAGLRLRLGLEADLLVVGEAGDGATALAQAQDLQPDIALVDVEMPGMDGVALTTALRQLVPRCAVIILSLHDDEATRQRAQAAGAVAFVAKQGEAAVLLATIREIGNRT